MRVDPDVVLMPRLTEAARRRLAMLRWSSAGVAAGVLLLAFLEWVAPGRWMEGITRDTLWWCLVACVPAALLVDRFVHHPATEGYTWVMFSTTAAFAILLVGFGATHAFYSRAAVALVFVLDTAWLMLGVRLLVRGHVMRLGVCEPQVMAQLQDARDAIAAQATQVRAELIPSTSLAELATLDGVIIDRYTQKDESLRTLLGALRMGSVRIYSADHVHELLTGRVSLEHTEDSFLDDSSGKILYSGFKRVLDIAGASLLLALFGLPMLIVALIVRLTSPGPALFRQPRIGIHGSVFEMLKFRTMVSPRGQGVDLGHQEDRVTPIGAVLRRFRIDELPQLINVLAGTMSLIGPRPEWTATADRLFDRITYFPYRHLVRPGITGWAQIHQGHVTGMADSRLKLEFDLYYVKHFSFALDLVIGLRTVRTILTGHGAR